jgi:hypothetical protein
MQEFLATLDFWDYVTFGSFSVLVVFGLGVLMLILGLPGKIAIARNHPEAEAVNVMGWVGFLAVVPWIQALIWAFKPTDVIDIRRFPREEQQAIREEIARIARKSQKTKATPPIESAPDAAVDPAGRT